MYWFLDANFADYSHMSNLLKIYSSEAANSFVEDSMKYALSYAAGGLRWGCQKTEKLKTVMIIIQLLMR